ncbi:hypothetical protein QM491_24505 [Flectobacillus sp. LYT7W]|nr:hypothetical protein [Flectobacillus longus]MDI9882634.1 hypothetical protein [Flectobacillus longus]
MDEVITLHPEIGLLSYFLQRIKRFSIYHLSTVSLIESLNVGVGSFPKTD